MSVAGTVRAPIDVVWNLFRPFGPEIMRWWPIYEWVELEPPERDEIGAVRHFKANGRSYRERLVLRDDAHYREQYAYVDSDVPIPFRSILTTVQMREVGNLETEVHWSSVTDVNPLFLPLVHSIQRQAYYKAIESLSRYFNPATEVLEILVADARVPREWGVLAPSVYVAVQVGDAPAQRTRIRPLSTRPRWNQRLSFNLGVLDQQIAISVWNATLGKDGLIGSASITIPSARSGDWEKVTVQLEGPSSGELTIAVRRQPEFRVLRETMSLAKTAGDRFGKLAPWLGQLGFEIEMLDTAVANIESAARDYLSRSLGFELRSLGNGKGPGNLAGALLLDLRRIAGGVQRTVESLSGQFLALSFQIIESIQAGEQDVYAYARYHRMDQLPGVPLENLPRMVKGLPRQEFLPPSKLGGMMQRGLEYLFSEFDLLDRYKRALVEGSDPFEAFFGQYVVRHPAIVDHWKDDAEFCRQMIQGLDPLMIRMVGSIREIPPAMATLSAQGKSLEALIEERRLFILDYAELAQLRLHGDMVFYAPIVLVYRELLDQGSRLNLVAIQLTRNEGPNIVYTASGSPPNRYLYAKIQVACADNQYHQFVFHLGLAHLATEPFVIAHHNAFWKKNHPIGALLEPHLRETIGINYLARQTLVAKKAAFTDDTFAPGTAQALQLFLSAWEKYDFMRSSFPEQLAARGFDEAASDGVQDYYYRDDGFKIWRALEAYVKEVVESVYADDRAVLADPILQNWAFECSSPERADIPGFPRVIGSRALLQQVLTTLIFHASAFHSAVNFPQQDYLSYIPNRPDSTLAKMPEGDADISMDFILLRAMPSFPVSNFQISFALLLTVPPKDANLANLPCPRPEFREIHARFQQRLEVITHEIKARNRTLEAAGKQPYPYLVPEQIAASVAI